MEFVRIFWKNNILLAKNYYLGANCLWDISPVMLRWLHTNPSKFDSVPNVMSESQKLSESQQGPEKCNVIISAKHYWFKKRSTSFLKWCVERSNRIHYKIKLSPITFALWSNHWTKNQLVHTCKSGEHMKKKSKKTWIKNLDAYMGFIHSKTF